MKQVAEKDITEAIKQLDLESQIEEKEDISGHNNRIFKVGLKNRTVICKFCTGENGSQDCKKEVNMHQLLKTQTQVKTPEILYSDASAEKTDFPYFITEYIEGESLQDRFPELDVEKQIEVVEQAGQILREVHSRISFGYAGELIPEKENIVVDGESNWVEFITEELNQARKKAEDTRFSDLTEKAEDLYLLELGDEEARDFRYVKRTEEKFNRHLKKTADDAGIEWAEDFSSHRFRKGFVHRMKSQHGLSDAKELSRHESPYTTQNHYLKKELEEKGSKVEDAWS